MMRNYQKEAAFAITYTRKHHVTKARALIQAMVWVILVHDRKPWPKLYTNLGKRLPWSEKEGDVQRMLAIARKQTPQCHNLEITVDVVV